VNIDPIICEPDVTILLYKGGGYLTRIPVPYNAGLIPVLLTVPSIRGI